MVEEQTFPSRSGWPALGVCLLLLFGSIPVVGILAAAGNAPWLLPLIPLLMLSGLIGLFGLMAIQPNQARVLLLFGEYKGSVKTSGFYWVNPFYSKKKISLRVRNFETGSMRPSKVNDRDGNPIDISAVVVWQVVNTADAFFEVDDYEDFVAVQSEAALRSLASRYPYDSEDHEVSLRGSTDVISEQLREDIQERLAKAGVSVIEARISHLAYAQEIAAAMLQRQQAQAVVAARTRIVEGAVSMVEMALERLAEKNVVELDDERRAAMVSNLLVVLCSDRHTQPVVNTGTLYQ